jgi:predicted aminopeptidase
MRACLRTALVCVLLMASGCANIGYYLQSVNGQLDIWRRERPIREVIADPGTPAPLKKKLAQVLEIRRFASAELDLPHTDSYTLYADLERAYVVWNVFAAPEFSMHPVQWCFPFAGCVNYRGYFSRTDAEHFAAGLAAQGDEIFIGGIPAYSTLGWFADPVLNTFIHYSDYRIAQLIFHELAHQKVYASGDSMFNESFAVVVEQEGVRRWLESHGTAQEKANYDREQQYREDFIGLVQAYHDRLSALYDSGGFSADTMRERKNQTLDEMMRDYERLKTRWGGYKGYDRWFERRPNNAQIASVAIYTKLVPGFRGLLRQHRGELPPFYAAVKVLASLTKEERTDRLERLAASGS